MNRMPVNYSTKFGWPIGIYSKLNFTVTVLVIFLITNCVSVVHSQESNFFMNHGDEIKFSSESNDNHLENLINKNLFSMFSNEMSILESIEETSENSDKTNFFSDTGYGIDYSQIAKFHPPWLDFKHQQIGVPVVQTVYIKNSDQEPLKLESISGSTKHFYCSFFVDKVIPVNGNSSFDVYFLARELGSVESVLFISTNKGILKYSIKGIGIPNQHKLKPILNAKIPINTTFTSVINLHNPTTEFLQVTEVYSSDDDLHLQVPNGEILELFNSGTEPSLELKKKHIYQNFNKNKWNLEPYETKPIMVMHFMGRSSNNHTAFICIKASQYSNKVTSKVPIINKTWDPYMDAEPAYNKEEKKEISFILPVELEVHQNVGVFAPYDQIDFGLVTFKKVNFKYGTFVPSIVSNYLPNSIYNTAETLGAKRVVDLYLANTGTNILSIQNISVSMANAALEIDFVKETILPPSVDQLTKVAKIKYNPLRSEMNRGQILVKTNDTNKTFSIDFKSDFLEGSLEYDAEVLRFRLDDETPNELWRNVELLNTFRVPLVIFKIELNQIAQNFFKIFDFNNPVYFELSSDTEYEKKHIFRLKFSKKQYIEYMKEIQSEYGQKSSISDVFKLIPKINIFTNLTNFEIPLNIYNNLLIFAKYDPKDEYSIKNLSELNIDFLTLNNEKKINFQIINPNPRQITISLVEIVKKSKINEDVDLNFRFKLIKYEPLIKNYEILPDNDLHKESIYFKINQKSKVDVPPQSRILVEFYMNSFMKKSKDNSFICTDLLTFTVKFLTDYENRTFPIQFKVLNGSINLLDRDSSELNKIKLKVFPYQKFKYPVILKSSFAQYLQIESLEFKNYGNLLNFKWEELNENSEDGEKNYVASYALIRPNATTLVGNLEFDPKLLCQHPYLGIESNGDFSIKKISNAIIEKLDQLENASLFLVHDLWLKTFKINNLNFLSSENIYQAIDFDSKMLRIMDQNFKNLLKLKKEYKSSLDLKIGKKNEFNLNLSISFPIEFNFERPRIVQSNSISFDTTQVYLETSSRNITLFNPSQSSVLVQILLLDSYSSNEKFLDLIDSNRFLAKYKNLTNYSNKIFSISLIHKHLTQHQRINKLLHDLDIQPHKKSIVTILEPYETVYVKIKFSPTSLGLFENYLIIRNNLTVLETYHLKAEAATAEIRINNQAPTHTSNFKNNKEFRHKTVDQSFLDISMETESEICQSMSRDRIDTQLGLFTLNSSLSSIFEYLNVLDDSSGNCVKKSDSDCFVPRFGDTSKKWFKNREGIVLRNLFQVENIGRTDLLVYKILLDGEPCISQGFEVYNCRPFKLSKNLDSKFHLDIRYQPDFTTSIILKRLTLVTNIGDLEYFVRVNIPHELLTFCHDSLPRPPLESYLIYLCLTLLTFLLTIIFISAIFESKSMVNFQMTNLKRSFGQKKEFTTVSQIATELSLQKDESVPTKHPTQNITRAKSLNENDSKQVKSPKTGRKNMSMKNMETKSKSKKIVKEKENTTFGFEPIEIDIKASSSPKAQKREEKIEPILTESAESKNKKEKKKNKTSKQAKSENEKIANYKTISSSSSGSISGNSSGTSTPSPFMSLSPVQFPEAKPKTQAENNNNDKMVVNNKEDSAKIEKKILIQNTIDDTLNNTNKNDKIDSTETDETFKQNLTMLNLLNILNYQQEPAIDLQSPYFRNNLILSHLKQFQQSNQLAQMSSLFEFNPNNESVPNYKNDSMPLFTNLQDVSNFNQNLNPNFQEYEYDTMVQQTEKFDSEFFRHNRDEKSSEVQNMKIPLNKTHSMPLNHSMSDFNTKKYSFEDNRHKKIGPIERPKNGLFESQVLKSNGFGQNSNHHLSMSNRSNQEPLTFNEFKLFGSEIKSDLDNALESLVPSCTSQLNQNQAWNSVLLNELNNIPTINRQDPVDLIKNIWSDEFVNDKMDNFGK